jgi:Spherulation-specific family 4
MAHAARIISAFLVIAGAVGCGSGQSDLQEGTSNRPISSDRAYSQVGGTIIPLYSWPTDNQGNVIPDWNTVASEQQKWPSIAVIPIVNVRDGPGRRRDANYAKGINVLVSGGCKLAAYVYTQYGRRSLTKVERDIDNWKAWYPQVTALFLDEMSYTSGKESYYSTLTSYAKNHGFDFVIGNPGTATLPSYIGTVDTIVVYEDAGVPTSFSSWQASYGRMNFATLSYSVPFSSFPSSQVTANKSSVGYQYVTDDGPDGNPWDQLSTYLDTLLSLLNG